jgi:hypothetical protein
VLGVFLLGLAIRASVGFLIPVDTEGGETFLGIYNEAAFGSAEQMGDWTPPRLVDEEKRLRGRTYEARDRERLGVALQNIRNHLRQLFPMMLAKVGRYLGVWAPNATVPGKVAYNAALWVGCILGTLRLCQRREAQKPLFAWSLVVLGGTLLQALIFYGNVRFRYPASLFFAIAWAATLTRLGRRTALEPSPAHSQAPGLRTSIVNPEVT